MKETKKPSKKTYWFVLRANESNTRALDMIKRRNVSRKKAVQALLSEGFSLREIGKFLGLTGQRVSALVRYWGLQ